MNQVTDAMIAHGAGQANAQLAQMLQAIAPLFKQAEQVVQAKMPKPQLPPNEQAALQIAQMDNQRKTEIDKATFGLKQQEFQARQAELQAEQRLAQMEAATKAQQQQLDNQLAQMEAVWAVQHDKLLEQTKVMMNDADNRQHQITEILKNQDDNRTAQLVELQRQHGAAQREVEGRDVELEKEALRIAGQIEIARIAQVGATPEPVEGTDANTIMQQLMETQNRLLEHIGKPRRLTVDPVTGQKMVEIVNPTGV